MNQLNNYYNLLAIHHYKPDKVIIIENTLEYIPSKDDFLDYLKKQGYKITLLSYDMTQKGYIQVIADSLFKKAEDLFVMPSSDTVDGYEILLSLINSPIQVVYIEKDGDIYKKTGNRFKFVTDSTDITVDDLISLRGGQVTAYATDEFKDPRLVPVLEYIEAHYETYKTLFRYEQKRKLYLTTDDYNPYKLNANLHKIDDKLIKDFKAFLDMLVTHDIVNYHATSHKKYVIFFKEESHKSYLLKSGTWLEHRLYLLLESLNISDLEAGLSFKWHARKKANNEFDVVGTHKNQLLMASCKDTHNIKPDQINEIYSYTTHLGSKSAIKMLFTTSDISASIKSKADEFGVNIITYDFSPKHTTKQLRHLLN